METVTVITEKKEKKRRNASSPWRQAFKKIKKNKMALVGFYALIFMFLFGFELVETLIVKLLTKKSINSIMGDSSCWMM